MPDLLALGECMVELYCDGPIAAAPFYHKSFGGDTLNTLVAAARLGSTTGYLTRIGEDPFTAFLLASWQQEGIDTSQVRAVPGFNGLYFISLLDDGEREFTYYRAGSAASTISPDDLQAEVVAAARILHVSGISQALSPSARAAVLAAIQQARAAGTQVSYDPNWRRRLWSSEAEARAAFEEVLPYVTIALPSAPEELTFFLQVETAEEAIAALLDRGVEYVAVKAGKLGAVVGSRTDPLPLTVPPLLINPVDTTGAGDAFNGGFLHGLLAGLSPFAAAVLGVVTSGLKVRGRGAVASLPDRGEAYEAWHSHFRQLHFR